MIVGDARGWDPAVEGEGGPGYLIDDLEITARIAYIDGSGGVLGQAGPQWYWTNGIAINGMMEFDSADAADMVASGDWGTVVLHEMLHVVGIGTMWEVAGLVTETIDDNGTRKPKDDTWVFTYEADGTLARDPDGNVPGSRGGRWCRHPRRALG